jgi:hypothetical protein
MMDVVESVFVVQLKIELVILAPRHIGAQIVLRDVGGSLGAGNARIVGMDDVLVGAVPLHDIHQIALLEDFPAAVTKILAEYSLRAEAFDDRNIVGRIQHYLRFQKIDLIVAPVTIDGPAHVGDPAVVEQLSAIRVNRLVGLPHQQFAVKRLRPFPRYIALKVIAKA